MSIILNFIWKDVFDDEYNDNLWIIYLIEIVILMLYYIIYKIDFDDLYIFKLYYISNKINFYSQIIIIWTSLIITFIFKFIRKTFLYSIIYQIKQHYHFHLILYIYLHLQTLKWVINLKNLLKKLLKKHQQLSKHWLKRLDNIKRKKMIINESDMKISKWIIYIIQSHQLKSLKEKIKKIKIYNYNEYFNDNSSRN